MKRILLLYILPPILRFFVRIVYLFGRKKIDGLEKFVEYVKKGPVIIATWHGDLTPVTAFFSKHIVKLRKVYVLVSPSNDGVMLGKVIKGLGGYYKTGDSRNLNKNIGGITSILHILKEEKGVAVFACDGPLGPLHKMKPGAVICANKCKVPIFCVSSSARKAFRPKKAWDMFFFPSLFTKIEIRLSQPFYPTGKIKADLESLETLLLSLKRNCDESVGISKDKEN